MSYLYTYLIGLFTAALIGGFISGWIEGHGRELFHNEKEEKWALAAILLWPISISLFILAVCGACMHGFGMWCSTKDKNNGHHWA